MNSPCRSRHRGTPLSPASLLLALSFLTLGLAGPSARAERPMVTDDAGTLAPGLRKLEGGLTRADGVSVIDLGAGYGLLPDLELGLALARANDAGHAREAALSLKWVPLKPRDDDAGLSAGLRLDLSDQRVTGLRSRGITLMALVTWSFDDDGPSVHANAGWSQQRPRGGRRSSERLWSLGGDVPLAERWAVTADVFGASGSRPGHQLGVRYAISEDLKLSAAVAREGGTTVTGAGVAWEF